MRRPSPDHGVGVGIIKEYKGGKLRYESILNREKQGRPGYGWSKNPYGISCIGIYAAVVGPFKPPVDGPKKRDYLPASKLTDYIGGHGSTHNSSIADLNWFNDM